MLRFSSITVTPSNTDSDDTVSVSCHHYIFRTADRHNVDTVTESIEVTHNSIKSPDHCTSSTKDW